MGEVFLAYLACRQTSVLYGAGPTIVLEHPGKDKSHMGGCCRQEEVRF